MKLLAMMTCKPSEIIGIDRGQIAEAKKADLVILDLESNYTIQNQQFLSMGKNTPFNGYKVTGKVETTIVGGKVVYQGGKIQC